MRRKGPWSSAHIEGYLREARIPIRMACNGASGTPLMVSLWFVLEEGRIWCATQRGSSVVSLLGRDPRCGFEVSVETPPYRGIRGTGVASLHDARGEEILKVLIERYLGGMESRLAEMLLERASQETAICIEPHTLVSWDYAERMAGAG